MSEKDFTEEDRKNLESIFCYDDLPEHFTERAKELFPVVKKLFPGLSFKDWINDFKYDLYPEREITKWADEVKHYLNETGREKVSPKTNNASWARILNKMNEENYLKDLLKENGIEFKENEEDIFEKEVKPSNLKQSNKGR